MNSKTYKTLVHKMNEVSDLSPQTVGPFTPLYKAIVPYFKTAPWIPLFLGSCMVALLAFLLLGTTVVSVVSVLQHGF